MSPEHKIAMLEAIDQLIEHYSRFEADEVPDGFETRGRGCCPLCAMSTAYEGILACAACPWVLFEGYKCAEGVAGNWATQTTAQRLERLNRWKTLINEGQP